MMTIDHKITSTATHCHRHSMTEVDATAGNCFLLQKIEIEKRR